MAALDRGRPGAVYNIGGGSRVSMLEILNLLRRPTGRTLDVRQEPAQKGDMRDTLESGLSAECDWMARLMAVPLR